MTLVQADSVKLSPSQVDYFDKYGYLVVANLFHRSACEELKRVAAEFADDDFSVYLNIHRDSPFFLKIMKDPSLVAMVKAVQRHNVVGLNDQYLYKKAGTKYSKQSWVPHQDNAYTQAVHGAYLQLHIFLDDSDPENGGLYLFPGSHKEDILPYTYKISWREKAGSDGITRPGWECEVPEHYQKLDVVASAGSIFLQHGNLIHGSYPNLSPRRDRQQYSIAYINEGASYNVGKASKKIPVPLDQHT